ncbi:MAG: (2Fe-2S)-binding protein, partial [Deltaproteobacteria bacterium]|nr:(2Fe-2S)-binding protein [Deltaproteobacteria bacterium]
MTQSNTAVNAAMIPVTIDGKETQIPSGTTILQGAAQLGIRIPTLCNH